MSDSLKNDVFRSVMDTKYGHHPIIGCNLNHRKQVQKVKTSCYYKTPCGWCFKWNKKCDSKIGKNNRSR